MKSLLVLVPFFFFSTTVVAQQSAKTINHPYEGFSKAYHTLDATILADQYVEDAVLVNLYQNGVPNSIKGAPAIKNYFQSFFEKIKRSDQTLELTFKITDREKVGNRYYDNGYYQLKVTGSEQTSRISYGKLSTVLIWDKGKWKFQVDANTNTTKAQYETAKTNTIPQPEEP